MPSGIAASCFAVPPPLYFGLQNISVPPMYRDFSQKYGFSESYNEKNAFGIVF